MRCEGASRRSRMPRYLRGQRRDRASGSRHVAVFGAQIGANQHFQVSSMERLLEGLMPRVKRTNKSISDQRLL